jgi:hypothetical protein
MTRERQRKEITHKASGRGHKSVVSPLREISSFGVPSPDVGYSIACRPGTQPHDPLEWS